MDLVLHRNVNIISKRRLQNTMLGVLVSLFEKYLIRRLQLTPEEAKINETEAIGLMVGIVISRTKGSVENFDPGDLFKVLDYVIENPEWVESSVPYLMESKDSYINPMVRKGLFAQVCYLGELVYYCTTLEKHPASPIKKIYTESESALETNLITAIGRRCSPELVIALFSVFRNYFATFYTTKYGELISLACSTVDQQIGFSFYYAYYSKFLASVENFPDLMKYLNEFIMFLRSNLTLVYYQFSENLLLHNENLVNAFRDKASFLLLTGNERYLIKLLYFFMVMICFLREHFGSWDGLYLKCFRELPEFYKYRWTLCNYTAESISSNIFEEVTQVLDYLFFANLARGYHGEYYNLYKDVNNVIIQHFRLTPADIKRLQIDAIFPFFGIA